FEAATNSSLRVLSDQSYSYRNSADHALTAIGMIVKRAGKWYMKPLCLPIKPDQMQRYKPYFPHPILRVYNGSQQQIFNSEFAERFPTWHPAAPNIVQKRVPLLEWERNFNEPTVRRRGPAILHQETDENAASVPCLVRTLGWSNGRQIPSTKKHELLIPFPEHAGFRADDPAPADRDLIAIPEVIINRFERLADELNAQWDGPNSGEEPRPYEPRPTRP